METEGEPAIKLSISRLLMHRGKIGAIKYAQADVIIASQIVPAGSEAPLAPCGDVGNWGALLTGFEIDTSEFHNFEIHPPFLMQEDEEAALAPFMHQPQPVQPQPVQPPAPAPVTEPVRAPAPAPAFSPPIPVNYSPKPPADPGPPDEPACTVLAMPAQRKPRGRPPGSGNKPKAGAGDFYVVGRKRRMQGEPCSYTGCHKMHDRYAPEMEPDFFSLLANRGYIPKSAPLVLSVPPLVSGVPIQDVGQLYTIGGGIYLIKSDATGAVHNSPRAWAVDTYRRERERFPDAATLAFYDNEIAHLSFYPHVLVHGATPLRVASENVLWKNTTPGWNFYNMDHYDPKCNADLGFQQEGLALDAIRHDGVVAILRSRIDILQSQLAALMDRN